MRAERSCRTIMPTPYSAIDDAESEEDSFATTLSAEHRDLRWWLKRIIVGALVGTCTAVWVRAVHRRGHRHRHEHTDNFSAAHIRTHAPMGTASAPALNYTQLELVQAVARPHG